MSAPSSPLRQTLKLMRMSSTASTGPMYAPLQQAAALGMEQQKHENAGRLSQLLARLSFQAMQPWPQLL